MKSGFDYNASAILPHLNVLAVKRGRKATAKCLTTKESFDSMTKALGLDFSCHSNEYKERTPFATDIETRHVYYTQAFCRQYVIHFADSFLYAWWNPISRECVVEVDFIWEDRMNGFKFKRTK